MKNLFLYFSVIFLVLNFGCNSNKDISDSTSSKSSDVVEVVDEGDSVFLAKELTQRYIVPGVQSNLKSTCSYSVVLSGVLPDGCEITNVLVDSILIPILHLEIEGKRMKNTGLVLTGNYQDIGVYVARYIYHKSFPTDRRNKLEEVEYKLSGIVVPEGEMKLEIIRKGEEMVIDLGKITTLEKLYRP